MAQQTEFHVDASFESKLPYKVTPTKLSGVYLNPALPADLDLHKATPEELVQHGFLLPKPTKDSPAHEHAVWNRLASSKLGTAERVEPVFEVRKGETHHLKDKPTKKNASDTNWVDTVWGGAGINTGNWTVVIGTWTIPFVSAPPEAQGTEGGWNSSSWMGIDGMFTSNDVLQAGIQQRVDANGNATYVAWYEWYAPWVPGSPPYVWQTNIPNFPAKPGDRIYCYVAYTKNNTAGYLFLYNETANYYVSFTLVPPPGANFNASSAEWIMEAPDGGEPISSMPRFTPVIFTNCYAWGKNGSVVPQNCDTLAVRDASGKILTYTTTNSNTLTISFTG